MQRPDYGDATPEDLARAVLKPVKAGSRSMDQKPPSDTEAPKPHDSTAATGEAQQPEQDPEMRKYLEDMNRPDPEGDELVADMVAWTRKHMPSAFDA